MDIEVDLSNSYGAFVKIDPTDFKRTLSNLINNSIEALSESIQGKVKVQVRCLSEISMITIQDNGKGIPSNILPLLSQQGFSHGKNSYQSGNGLGLWHARKTIEGIGGSFKIESTPNEGTTVTMKIPNAERPEWFIDSLTLTPRQSIIICDDDSSIHGLWTGRLNSLGPSREGSEVFHFTSAEQFSIWQIQNPNLPRALYLMDYELLGSSKTGLDLIEDHNLKDRAILVTSRYEEDSIRQRCLSLGVKIIPKGMAGFISLKVRPAYYLWDSVLIDDDPLVHATWKFAAEDQKKSFVGFYNHLDFLNRADQFDVKSKIYVDSNLGNGIKGEEIAKQISDLGFENIYLCTGYRSSDFAKMPWIKDILGKDPQF